MIKHKGLEEIRMQISEKTKKEVDDLFDAIEQAYELGCRDTEQKLNIAGVSGKRPDYNYLQSIKQQTIDVYDRINKPRSIYQDGYRDGFIDGADHFIKAACASSAVDKTVSGGCNCGNYKDPDDSGICDNCFGHC